MSLLVIGVLLGGLAALAGIVLLVGALCLAASYGDEIAERAIAAVETTSDEAGAVIYDFSTGPAS